MASCLWQPAHGLGASMFRIGRWIGLVLCGLPLFLAYSFGQAPLNRPGLGVMGPVARPGVTPHPAIGPRTDIGVPVVPSGPLPQVPMAQLPSSPPQVTYKNSMLTIVAQN